MGSLLTYAERNRELLEYLLPHTPEELEDLQRLFEDAGHGKVANALLWYRTIGFRFSPYFDYVEQAIRGPLNKLPTLMYLDEMNRIVARWRFALGK
jgi:hypothetical protein